MQALKPRSEEHTSELQSRGHLVPLTPFPTRRSSDLLGFLLLGFAFTFFSTRWLPSAQYGFTVAELGAALIILSQPRWLVGMVGADFLRSVLVALPNHASTKTMDRRLAFNGVDGWRLRVTKIGRAH